MRARTHFETWRRATARRSSSTSCLPGQQEDPARAHRELVNDKKIEASRTSRTSRTSPECAGDRAQGGRSRVILNNLFKQTQLQDTFGVNMWLLDASARAQPEADARGVPRAPPEVVTRARLLTCARREEGHIQEGLAIALSNVDESSSSSRNRRPARRSRLWEDWKSQVVEEMSSAPRRTSPSRGDRRVRLQKNATTLRRPGQAILEMRLAPHGWSRTRSSPSTRADRQIADLLDILASRADHGDHRRGVEGDQDAVRRQRKSEIVEQAEDLQMEDLIASETW